MLGVVLHTLSVVSHNKQLPLTPKAKLQLSSGGAHEPDSILDIVSGIIGPNN
jgi:hypothetical protein